MTTRTTLLAQRQVLSSTRPDIQRHMPVAGQMGPGVRGGDRIAGDGRAKARRNAAQPGPLRRLVYRVYALLPTWGQAWAIALAAPKVTLGACAVIEDERGRVLVAHHTYRRRAWGLPGGLIRHGEQPAEALARELCEELGGAAYIGPMLGAHTALPVHHLTLFYRVTLVGTPRPDGIELDGLRFVALDELPALLGRDARAWLPFLERRRAS